jgi:hypothetical protein
MERPIFLHCGLMSATENPAAKVMPKGNTRHLVIPAFTPFSDENRAPDGQTDH